MFRTRLAHLALAAGLGLVSGCSSCYSVTIGSPGSGSGLFSRLHQNSTPAPAPCNVPVTPGCGCAASPGCDGPIMDGYGGGIPVPGYGGEHVPSITNAPHLVTPPAAPTVPYVP
jgi:hypothetical protein